MSSIPTNIAPIAISSQNNKNGRCNNARKVKVNQISNQKKRKNKKDNEFPMGKEVFNDPYSLADEKYRLLVDISVLQNEVEPLRTELEQLKYFIKRTQDSHELKQAEQIESLDQEYDNLCIEYDKLDNLYSDIVLEQNQKYFEIMKQRQKILMMDLEDAEKALLNIETEFADPRIAKYEKKYTQNEVKIANLKKIMKDLKKQEKDLNVKVANSFSKNTNDDKNAELIRLTNNYNALKVTSLNKKHELEFMEKSFNARAERIKQVIQVRKSENDEKQERRQFNVKMKKKKEDNFLFDSYMREEEMQNIREPERLQNDQQKNPRGRNHSDDSSSHAKKTQKFKLKLDTYVESADNFSTDNFESFSSPCQSPVSTQNIEQKDKFDDDKAGLSETKTFGTDDFNSTSEFSSTRKSINIDDNNSKANFAKSLQSELGSDEEGDLNSTSHLNETAKNINLVNNNGVNKTLKDDNKMRNNTSSETERESQTEAQEDQSETEHDTEKENQSETANDTEKENQSEVKNQTENEYESQTETVTDSQNEKEKESKTETENESQTETENQTETERDDQSEEKNQTETENQTDTEKDDQSEVKKESQAETENESQNEAEEDNNGGTHLKNQNCEESTNGTNEDDDIISNSMAETESCASPPHSPLDHQLNNATSLLLNKNAK